MAQVGGAPLRSHSRTAIRICVRPVNETKLIAGMTDEFAVVRTSKDLKATERTAETR
jgi:hypothetical protein